MLSQVSEPRPGAPLFVLRDEFSQQSCMAVGATQGHELLLWSGRVSCFPRSQNRDLHPANKDLFAGTPDLGHPFLCGAMNFQGRSFTALVVRCAIHLFRMTNGSVMACACCDRRVGH